MVYLERLSDQFNLANAARTELDVPASLIAKDHFAIDLALHAANIVESFHIEGLVINKCADHVEKRAAQRAIPGNRPGFQQCQAFPRREARAVIALEAIEWIGEIAGFAFRSQPQVYA